MKEVCAILVSPTQTFENLRQKPFLIQSTLTISLFLILVVWLDQPLFLSGNTGFTSTTLFDDLINYVYMLVSLFVKVISGGMILYLINWIMKGVATLKQMMLVMLISSVPLLLSNFMSGIIARVTQATNLDQVAMNASLFFENKSGALFHFSTLMDPFLIWEIILMILGATVMNRKSFFQNACWISLIFIFIIVIQFTI